MISACFSMKAAGPGRETLITLIDGSSLSFISVVDEVRLACRAHCGEANPVESWPCGMLHGQGGISSCILRNVLPMLIGLIQMG